MARRPLPSVMARGDGGKAVLEKNGDRFAFLGCVGKVCGSHIWRMRARALLGNHFHLPVETPVPNLFAGI